MIEEQIDLITFSSKTWKATLFKDGENSTNERVTQILRCDDATWLKAKPKWSAQWCQYHEFLLLLNILLSRISICFFFRIHFVFTKINLNKMHTVKLPLDYHIDRRAIRITKWIAFQRAMTSTFNQMENNPDDSLIPTKCQLLFE